MAKKNEAIIYKQLQIGDKAPSLKDLQWVKGSPTDVGEKVTIVEIWATWCGPCLDSIPHLTELQKLYAEKLNVVGITDEKKKVVLPFLKEMGDSMDYHVGIAPESLYNSYMEGVGGIPHAFLVDKDGYVIWSCHPSELDPVLEGFFSGRLKPKDMIKGLKKKEKISDLYNKIAQVNEKQAIVLLDKLAKQSLDLVNERPEHSDVFYSVFHASLPFGDYKALDFFCKELATDKLSVSIVLDFTENLISLAFDSSVCLINAISFLKYILKKEPKNIDALAKYSRVLYTLGLVEEAAKMTEEIIKLDVDGIYSEMPKTLETYRNFLAIRKKYKLGV